MNGLELDLSGLESGFSDLLKSSEPQAAKAGSGEPIQFNIADIEEDPNQPRQSFDEEALAELADSIRADKVRVPISVKPKNADGKYIINHGARRYRASILAGKQTIPGFIDDSHDDYAQVVENIQRDNLTPLEIAKFIEKRRVAGDKDKVIGERLGKSKSYISMHGALLNWPAYIEEVYNADLCREIMTLYNLVQLNKKAPSEVEELCRRGIAISRRDVAALEAKVVEAANSTKQSLEPKTEVRAGETATPDETPNSTAQPQAPFVAVTELIPPDDAVKKPIVQVKFEGDLAYLELKKRAGYGFGWIKLHSTGEEREVPLSAIALEAIVEG